MITPVEIRQKAERWYISFLQNWLQNEQFFPRDMGAGAVPDNFVDLRSAIEALYRQAKERRGYGYSIVSRFKRMRQHGDQHIPERIVIETQQDFLRLVEKEDEFARFCQDVALIRASMPQLNEWMIRVPQRVIEQHDIWPDLLAVCAYFLEHPRPHIYVRQLPIPVHTKFIEQHRSILQELLKLLLPSDTIDLNAATFEQRFGLREEEPLIRVRLLDEQLLKRYAIPLDDLTLPCSQFAALELQYQKCLITENKKTFLTLPMLPGTFAIFGSGFMVSSLSAIPWLSTCPVLYWGDLDAQGFQILSLLRSTFPRVTSLMMDEATFQSFSNFCVTSTPCSVQHLPYLTPEEHKLFNYLAEKNTRLEQEHISHTYAMRCIHTRLQTLA